MEGFITAVLVIFLIAWVIGKILPFIIKWYLKRKFGINSSGFTSENTREDYHNYKDVDSNNGSGARKEQQTAEEKREGVVTRIVVTEEKEKIIDNDLGEYVEYEEVSETRENKN